MGTVGAQLICVGNNWMGLSDRMGRKAVMATFIATHGTFIPAPVCGTGAGTASLIFATPQAIDSSKLFSNYRAVVASGGWTVIIEDGTGAPIGGDAVVETVCWYS